MFTEQYQSRIRPHEELHISYVQLYNIVESYFQDVDRYKQYHFRDPANSLINAKKAALTLKWLLRVKPLYVHNTFSLEEATTDFQYDDFSIILNELFAIFVAECFLKIVMSDQKFGELLYLIRYRNVDEYMLMAVFQLIMDLRDGEAVTL